MTALLADRVKETSLTSGTGAVTLAGAMTGFQAFSEAFAVGSSVYYAITDSAAGTWEIGIGTLSAATTLTRNTVLESSSAGSLVNFSTNIKEVFCTVPASALSGRYIGTQYFTSSGTYDKRVNKPSFIVVEVQGGGGAGGHGGTTSAAASGGTSGGYVKKKLLASEITDTVDITVATAAAGRTSAGTGTAGGSSSFGSYVTAGGGGGGIGNSSAAATISGGTASAGDLSIPGASMEYTTAYVICTGMNSMLGVGGSSSNATTHSAMPGNGYGSGGGAYTQNSTSYSSGAGAPGIVIVHEYA